MPGLAAAILCGADGGGLQGSLIFVIGDQTPCPAYIYRVLTPRNAARPDSTLIPAPVSTTNPAIAASVILTFYRTFRTVTMATKQAGCTRQLR